MSNLAGRIAAEVQGREGGRWCGVVRPEGQAPDSYPDLIGREAKRWAGEHIRNGPDGPGRRFLRDRRKLAEIAKLPKDVSEPRNTVASRAMLDRLAEPMELTGAPVQFDPDNDPELQENPSWEQG